MVPTPDIDQVTAVLLEPETVALNVAEPPFCTAAAVGDIVTDTDVVGVVANPTPERLTACPPALLMIESVAASAPALCGAKRKARVVLAPGRSETLPAQFVTEKFASETDTPCNTTLLDPVFETVTDDCAVFPTFTLPKLTLLGDSAIDLAAPAQFTVDKLMTNKAACSATVAALRRGA